MVNLLQSIPQQSCKSPEKRKAGGIKKHAMNRQLSRGCIYDNAIIMLCITQSTKAKWHSPN